MKLTYCLMLIPSILLASENGFNPDLSKKLDLILGKIASLETRILRLESDSREVNEEIKKVSELANKIRASGHPLSIPEGEQEKKSFFNQLRLEMQSDKDRSAGPWTNTETWEEMRKNLTGFKVRKLLGNPNMIKGNLNPRVDQVYHYRGDLDGDGQDERGEVHFFRDRVVSFKSPF